MENHPMFMVSGNKIILRKGFRFHPTDDELIVYYLHPKTRDYTFVAFPIGEADLKELEPWQLPSEAMGEDEWYFFCLTVKRYPTGKRTNRGTYCGYWKATGKDKQIYSGKDLVGVKKTLVFYQGKAPNGHKTNWVMHEYRLDGVYSKDNLPELAQNDWVISRVFHKKQSGKKTHISDLPPPADDLLTDDGANHIDTPSLVESYPALVDTSNPFQSYSPFFADDYDGNSALLLADDDGAGNDLAAIMKGVTSEVTDPGGGIMGTGYFSDEQDTNVYFNF